MSARRGQVLPIAAGVLTLTVLVFTFFLNVAGYQTTASIAIDSAARSAGLAALTGVDTTENYTRWFIDPDEAMALAREYAALTLLGDSDPALGTGSLTRLFVSSPSLETLLDRVADTNGDGTAEQDGIDVEVINPAMNGLDESNQTSWRFLNGDGGTTDATNGVLCPVGNENYVEEGYYPESVVSLLDGTCYSSATVIVRLRLHARQSGGGSVLMTRTVAVSFGTNS